MTETFAHPETGELLETEDDFRQAIAELDDRRAPLYTVWRQLLEARAERFDPPAMPRARERTEKQERVARCPRCGSRISERPLDGGAAEV